MCASACSQTSCGKLVVSEAQSPEGTPEPVNGAVDPTRSRALRRAARARWVPARAPGNTNSETRASYSGSRMRSSVARHCWAWIEQQSGQAGPRPKSSHFARLSFGSGSFGSRLCAPLPHPPHHSRAVRLTACHRSHRARARARSRRRAAMWNRPVHTPSLLASSLKAPIAGTPTGRRLVSRHDLLKSPS